jgi:hypothetical protein
VVAVGGLLALAISLGSAPAPLPTPGPAPAAVATAVPPAAAPAPAPVASPVAASGPLTLIPRHADWRFHDHGSDLGTAWRAPEFDDHDWKTGAAPLGYGDPWIRTQVAYGDPQNRYRTTYYRREFTVAAGAAFTTLDLTLMRDDGAVLYLNGREIARSNMPDGPVTYGSEAKTLVGNADEERYWPISLEARDLHPGRNVIAVEVHQFGARTTDQSFDLDLIAR